MLTSELTSPPLPIHRPRRNRYHPAVRGLIQETTLLARHLVTPLFLLEGEGRKSSIASLPGVERMTIDYAADKIRHLLSLGISTFLLFPFVEKENKDLYGHYACAQDNLINRAVAYFKKNFPTACFMADVALDPYTLHGHDGVMNDQAIVDNDLTLAVLGQMALAQARAGIEIVAPSDMMDGRIGYIRTVLDQEGFSHVGIMSYSAKYASSLYRPFREALDSAPQYGDKRSYQLNPANSREAVREMLLDIDEGADILLIKPASLYLDIIHLARQMSQIPIAAYHVSGEYAMAMAAGHAGWLDPIDLFAETFLSCRRAGADFIISYASELIAPRCPL